MVVEDYKIGNLGNSVGKVVRFRTFNIKIDEEGSVTSLQSVISEPVKVLRLTGKYVLIRDLYGKVAKMPRSSIGLVYLKE